MKPISNDEPEPGSLHRIVRRMWVVSRRSWGHKEIVAIFASREMASEWIAAAPHRDRDIVRESSVEINPPNDQALRPGDTK